MSPVSTRTCPACGGLGMAAATRCGFCWVALTPEAEPPEADIVSSEVLPPPSQTGPVVDVTPYGLAATSQLRDSLERLDDDGGRRAAPW